MSEKLRGRETLRDSLLNELMLHVGLLSLSLSLLTLTLLLGQRTQQKRARVLLLLLLLLLCDLLLCDLLLLLLLLLLTLHVLQEGGDLRSDAGDRTRTRRAAAATAGQLLLSLQGDTMRWRREGKREGAGEREVKM